MTDDAAPPPSAAPAPPKAAAGSVKAFTCPSCGGTISIRAAGLSITAICSSCGSIIDVANDNLNIIRKAAVKIKQTRIPLGARGALFGTVWEVIGYTGLSDGTGMYEWGEYLLFNPYQGFRFLTEENGHWNFVKMLRQHISGRGTADSIGLEDGTYRIFNRGDAIVQYVMGEFYWRVKVKDHSHVADYVAPPYILSMEESAGDIIWSKGIYVDSDTIQQAFKLADKRIYGGHVEGCMPWPKGISPNQPSPYGEIWKSISMPVYMFIAALCIFQCIAVFQATNELIYDKTITATVVDKGQTVLADPIEIPGKIGNLKVLSHSPVSNNWVDLGMSLVNTANNESVDFGESIEYYYGWDSDGHWHEGGRTTSTILSAVPGGMYRLMVEPDAGVFRNYYTGSSPVQITIQVIRNAPVWSNFWLALLLLVAYPFYVMVRNWSFETQRWADSDYAPGIYRRSNN